MAPTVCLLAQEPKISGSLPLLLHIFTLSLCSVFAQMSLPQEAFLNYSTLYKIAPQLPHTAHCVCTVLLHNMLFCTCFLLLFLSCTSQQQYLLFRFPASPTHRTCLPPTSLMSAFTFEPKPCRGHLYFLLGDFDEVGSADSGREGTSFYPLTDWHSCQKRDAQTPWLEIQHAVRGILLIRILPSKWFSSTGRGAEGPN